MSFPWIHHINIQALDVQESARFYRDVVGLSQGSWDYPVGATFDISPDRLAIFGEGNRGLHIVKPVPEFAVQQGLTLNPTVGGHFAVTVPDLDAVKARLRAAGVMYSDGGNFMPGVVNMYCYDPSMNLIEINQLV